MSEPTNHKAESAEPQEKYNPLEEDTKEGRLLRASKNGWEDIVRGLLEEDDKPDLNNTHSEDASGHTALCWAAAHGHEGVVRLLIQHGANVEAKSQPPNDFWYRPRTPLDFSAGNGHVNVVRALLEAGANPNGAQEQNQLTPLGVAAVRGYEDVVEALLETIDSDASTRAANHDKDSQGLDLEWERIDGRTTLSQSAEDGQLGIVTRLLEKGADMESKDVYSRTPISWAAEKGQTDVVNALLAHGADPDPKDEPRPEIQRSTSIPGGRTPLFYAAQEGHESVVRLLLRHKVDVNSCDNIGWSPLSRAVSRGQVSVVRTLLDNGADSDIGRVVVVSKIPLLEYVKMNDPHRPGFSEIHQMLLKSKGLLKPKGRFDNFIEKYTFKFLFTFWVASISAFIYMLFIFYSS